MRIIYTSLLKIYLGEINDEFKWLIYRSLYGRSQIESAECNSFIRYFVFPRRPIIESRKINDHRTHIFHQLN